MVGLKASLSAMLMLTIVATNFNGVLSVHDCVLPETTLDFGSVLETHTTNFGTHTVGGSGTTNTVEKVGVDVQASRWTKSFATVTHVGRLLTFSPDAANFKDYLDLERPRDEGYLEGYIFVECKDGADLYNVTGGFRILVNDTNNRSPTFEFEVEHPYIFLNLDTWQTNDPINFLEDQAIKVNDKDFKKENAAVDVTSANKIVFVEPAGVQQDTGHGWNSTYALFLNPDATYGNYTFELQVTDGTLSSAKNITLYIGAGAQFQATALTVLLVSLATWFNLK
jgi:hypothetical protein